MPLLREYSTKVLMEEIMRRQDAVNDEPQPLEDIDLDLVKKKCAKIIRDRTIHGAHPSTDAKNDVFKHVLLAIYGPEISDHFKD